MAVFHNNIRAGPEKSTPSDSARDPLNRCIYTLWAQLKRFWGKFWKFRTGGAKTDAKNGKNPKFGCFTHSYGPPAPWSMLFLHQLMCYNVPVNHVRSSGTKTTLIRGQGGRSYGWNSQISDFFHFWCRFWPPLSEIFKTYPKNVLIVLTGYKYIDLGGREQNLRWSKLEEPVLPTPSNISISIGLWPYFGLQEGYWDQLGLFL